MPTPIARAISEPGAKIHESQTAGRARSPESLLLIWRLQPGQARRLTGVRVQRGIEGRNVDDHDGQRAVGEDRRQRDWPVSSSGQTIDPGHQ